jgi:uncharacterized protein with HEPN domain
MSWTRSKGTETARAISRRPPCGDGSHDFPALRHPARSDLKTQAAVVHELPVLGEAVKRLSAPSGEEHPGVPWKASAGMRDRLLHGYDDVDLDLAWKTASEDLPALVEQLKRLAPRPDA